MKSKPEEKNQKPEGQEVPFDVQDQDCSLQKKNVQDREEEEEEEEDPDWEPRPMSDRLSRRDRFSNDSIFKPPRRWEDC